MQNETQSKTTVHKYDAKNLIDNGLKSFNLRYNK